MNTTNVKLLIIRHDINLPGESLPDGNERAIPMVSVVYVSGKYVGSPYVLGTFSFDTIIEMWYGTLFDLETYENVKADVHTLQELMSTLATFYEDINPVIQLGPEVEQSA